MNKKLVSIAIITRNRQKYLHKCLVSLQRQKKDLIKEILVIDNASSDNTKKIIATFRKTLPIRYIYESQVGIAYARNSALKESKGNLLVFIDDDCEAIPTWIEGMVSAHRRYPEAVAIQGKSTFVPKKSIFAKAFAFNYNFWIWKSMLDNIYISICDTCNLLIQPKEIKKLGIQFDTSFDRGSDVDFGQQILEKKQHIVYASNAEVYVSVRTNMLAMIKQRYAIGIASKKLENKWGIQDESHKNVGEEYKKRLKNFGGELSVWEKIQLKTFFRFYKPFYQLGRSSISGKTDKEKVTHHDKSQKRIDPSMTVAIVTRNRKASLLRCLLSIEQQTVFPHEVLIIDNASKDNTKSFLFAHQFLFPLRYVYEKHVGVAYARNRALKEAKGNLLAFIDDDCEAAPTWIEEMVNAHRKYPDAVAIQGKCIVYPQKGAISTGVQYLYDSWIQQNLYGKKIFVLDTANVSVKLPILQKKHIMFDTDFKTACDDVDFCYRLWKMRLSVYFVSLPIVHSWRPLSKISFVKQRFEKGEARALLDKKWIHACINNDVILNGTKIHLRKDEMTEHNSPKVSSMLTLKTYLIISLCRWIFHVSYMKARNRIPYCVVQSANSMVQLKTPSLTVGIITRNRADNLNRLLYSLRYQTIIPTEILIVDNGSTDRTREVIRSFQKILPIRYVYEKAVGRSHARNKVLDSATGKLLAFIDDDCEVAPTWIEDMIGVYRKYPHAAAIQGKAIYKPENTIKSTIFTLNYEYWLRIHIYKKNKLLVLDTKNVLLQLQKIKKLGIRFDIQFDTYHMIGEDVDLAKQLLAKKQEIIYSEQIFVYHHERKSMRDFLRNYYLKGKGKAFAEFKWPEKTKSSIKLHAVKEAKIKILQGTFHFYRKWLFLFLYRLSMVVILFAYNRNKFASYLLDIQQPIKQSSDFSVCIVTKNRSQNLYRCLFSLVKQTRTPAEVIIVDSSTNSQNTIAIIQKFKEFLSIRYMHEKAQGIGHARNTAMKQVKGSLFGFIDDDCEASPTWIEEMVKAHKKHPAAAVIQGKVFLIPFKGLISKVCQDEYYKWMRNNLQKNWNFFSLDFENTSFKRNILRGAKVACDTRYKKYYYCDDVDFGYQLLFANKTIKYYPKAYVFAKRKKTFFSLLWQRWLKGRSRAVLDIKWNFLRNNTSFYLMDKKIPLVIKNTMVKDNPFFVDNRHHVGRLMILFYPLFEKLFEKTYRLGYFFERVIFENNYRRLATSRLPDNVPIGKRLTVSVMLITKDRETVKRSLDSLLHQAVLPKEVIIIDASQISRENDIQNYKKKLHITYIYQRPLGFGIARNTAFMKASGDIIATLDDDGEVMQNWVEHIIKAHTYYPHALAMQGRIISMPKYAPIALVEQLHIEKWFLRQLDEDNSFHTVSTKNVSFKRKLFLREKLKFSEKKFYGIYGSEDIDMAYQISEKKLHIVYEPSIIAYHWERETLREYLQQQYRKGMGSALIARDWKNLIGKRIPYFLTAKFLEAIILIAVNPLTRKKIYAYPYLYILFFLTNIWYMKGKIKMTSVLEKGIKKQVVESTIVLFYIHTSGKTLYQQLSSLANQTVHPKKIILVTNGISHVYVEAVDLFSSVFPIITLHTTTRHIEEKVLQASRGEVITIFDAYALPSALWLENSMKAHRKYPDTYIQGITKLAKTNDVYTTIMQFIRQTHIRNSMHKDKKLYWAWMKGELKKNLYIHMYDIYNLSLKQHATADILSLIHFYLTDQNQREFMIKEKILLLPNIEVTRLNNMDQRAYFKKAWNLGKEHTINGEYKYIFTKNPLKRTGAFIYFCLKNKRLLTMPLLLFYFIIFQMVFLYAYKLSKRNMLLHTVRAVSTT